MFTFVSVAILMLPMWLLLASLGGGGINTMAANSNRFGHLLSSIFFLIIHLLGEFIWASLVTPL
jgi:hypothetical protein